MKKNEKEKKIVVRREQASEDDNNSSRPVSPVAERTVRVENRKKHVEQNPTTTDQYFNEHALFLYLLYD